MSSQNVVLGPTTRSATSLKQDRQKIYMRTHLLLSPISDSTLNYLSTFSIYVHLLLSPISQTTLHSPPWHQHCCNDAVVPTLPQWHWHADAAAGTNNTAAAAGSLLQASTWLNASTPLHASTLRQAQWPQHMLWKCSKKVLRWVRSPAKLGK